MKKEVSSGVFVAIILVALCAVVGLWFWQPWAPKIHGLEQPTAEDRHKAAEQMRKDMMESMQMRQRTGAPR